MIISIMIGLFIISLVHKYFKIKPFFFSLNKKQLFTQGDKLDSIVKYNYGIFLFYPFSWLISFLDPITYILVLDQVSRHYYRDQPERITQVSQPLIRFIENLINSSQYETLTLKEKAFVSLATRHLLRILSLSSSKHHQKISQLLQFQIEFINSQIDACARLPVPPAIDFVKLINSYNLKIYRLHQFVDPSTYQIWGQPPPPETTDSNQWIASFQETEIADYFSTKIDQLQTKLNSPLHVYLLISGGIDSMTMARIAIGLKDKMTDVIFHGIHINWRKRNEADLEAEQLEKFFARFDFDFRVYHSPIDPQSKNWDKESTDYRFQLLKQLEQQHHARTVFCLGHVIDDLVENLITNTTLEGVMTGKQTCLDLFGMRESIYSKVVLFRPLLLHAKPKPDHGTPFLRDNATSLDINRRIIRRAIKSCPFSVSRIRRVYHEYETIRQKYDQIVVEEKEINGQQYYTFLYDPNWNSVEWRYVINLIMRRYDLPNIKRNAIFTLIKRLSKPLPIKVRLSKPYQDKFSFQILPGHLLCIPKLS